MMENNGKSRKGTGTMVMMRFHFDRVIQSL